MPAFKVGNWRSVMLRVERTRSPLVADERMAAVHPGRVTLAPPCRGCMDRVRESRAGRLVMKTTRATTVPDSAETLAAIASPDARRLRIDRPAVAGAEELRS